MQMKRFSRTAVLAAAASLVTSAVSAAEANWSVDGWSGFYGELRAGITLLDNSSNQPNSTLVFPSIASNTDFETGAMGSIALGYGFADQNRWGSGLWNNIRLEAELQYQENDIDNVAGNPEVTALSYMGNVYYDFDLGSSFTPYIGVGLGATSLNVDGVGLRDDADTVFAYQLRGGVSYAFDQNIAASLGYRYFDADNPSLVDLDGTSFDTQYSGSALELGLRYNW